jgi:hypothetical protein
MTVASNTRVSMLIVVSTILLASAPVAAQSDLVVIQAKVNPVVTPKSPQDAFRDCAKDAMCRSLADAAAVWLGATPGTVTAAMAAIPQAKRGGEESWYKLVLPDGYQYCRAKIHTISVVPATGDRASYMGAGSERTGVSVYTWTPKEKVGGARSWVEAEFTITGVRDSVAAKYQTQGVCKPSGRTLVGCRGARGVNKGKPACGDVED